MKQAAILCSGQGAQYSGMGKELYALSPAVKAIYECGSDILGYDLAALTFEGEESALSRTAVSQPAIFAVSLAAHAAANELFTPTACAGHSLGEYAALTIAGGMTIENGFRVIAARAAAMQQAADETPGAMFAIVGSDEETVTRICDETPGFVLPVNFNAPTQTVIAGDPDAAAEAADRLIDLGAKSVRLSVSSAFHCKRMDGAAAEFAARIADIPISAPTLPFYCNATGALLPPDANLKDYLVKHLVSPVYFHKEIAAMLADGIDTFVELGPNKILTTLIKRAFKQAATHQVENKKTLEKLREAFSA